MQAGVWPGLVLQSGQDDQEPRQSQFGPEQCEHWPSPWLQCGASQGQAAPAPNGGVVMVKLRVQPLSHADQCPWQSVLTQ